MAAAGTKYTVFGFDSRLDGRPTAFVDGFPATKVCSACGLVPSTVALLPCRHALCQRCFDHCSGGESNRCPLDKEVHKTEDVTWSSTSKEYVLRRKIRCWNSSNGCSALGPASEVSQHFVGSCEYHAVSCCRCKKRMPCKDVCNHLETDNCSSFQAAVESRNPTMPEARRTLFSRELASQLDLRFSSVHTRLNETLQCTGREIQTVLDTRITEWLESLYNTLKESAQQTHADFVQSAKDRDDMLRCTGAVKEGLDEVKSVVNDMKESLLTYAKSATDASATCMDIKRDVDAVVTASAAEGINIDRKLTLVHKVLQEFGENEPPGKKELEGFKEDVSDQLCLLVNGCKIIVQNTLSVSETLQWTIESWSKQKNEASSEGTVLIFAEKPIYFYGYLILPGIEVREKDGKQSLHLAYQIWRGDFDPFLKWPFKQNLLLNVLDSNGRLLPNAITVNTGLRDDPNKRMPTTSKNEPLWSAQFVDVNDIDGSGFVTNDCIFVRFEVGAIK